MIPLPPIPDSWLQSIAAVGAIVVVVLVLRWAARAMESQSRQSQTLIDRSFDIADQIVTHGVKLHADEAQVAAEMQTDATGEEEA